MNQILDESGLPADVAGTVVTVGTFDGVHRGHLDVLGRIRGRAASLGMRSLLVTFDPHPLEIVNPSAAPRLLTVGQEKLEVLAESGIDFVAIVPFTEVLASLSAEQFVEQVLIQRYRMKELMIGYDHGFGRHRAGNVEVLKALGERDGFGVEVIGPVSTSAGQPVSSTSIRRSIAGGDLQRAALGLGRPYSVQGTVVKGAGRGKALGFATLNLSQPSPRKLLPPEGVYAVRVQTPAGAFGGMMNLGPRPTFNEKDSSLEVHMFDVEGDFYGDCVRVDFISFLRSIRKFAGGEQLAAQLKKDEESARLLTRTN